MPDYSSGNAPGGVSYAAPLQGFQFGQALANLPEQYMQGREQSRKVQMEDMFKGGVPKNEDGTPNVNEIIARGAQVGGLPFVQGMIPYLNDLVIGKQAQEGLMRLNQPYPGASTSIGSYPPPNAAGPAAMTARPQVANEDVYGKAPLINEVVARHFGPDGPQVDQSDIEKLASQLNINPNRPLNPRQVQQVQRALSRSALPTGPGPGNQETNQSNVENSAAEVNGNAAKPLPAGGVSGAAGPPPSGRTEFPSSFQERYMASGDRTGLAAGVSPQSADFYETRGHNKMAYATAIGRMSGAAGPKAAENIVKDAEKDFDKAKQIREQLGKAAEFTGPEKEARDPAVQAQKRQEEVQKGDIKVSEKTYPGLQMLGQTGKIGNDKIDRMRVQMSDPNFFSGAGNEIVQKFKQWSVSLGGNPNAANPIEELHKTVSQMLTDDIKAMGASGAGPVRVAEVQNMQKGIASLKQSPATVRYLLEELYRTHNDNIEVARLAQQYKSDPRGPGYLDANWDKIRDQYYQKHPLFSEEELADPRRVSPPLLPRSLAADPVKAKAWEKQQGLKSGDPIRTDKIDPKTGKPIIMWVR